MGNNYYPSNIEDEILDQTIDFRLGVQKFKTAFQPVNFLKTVEVQNKAQPQSKTVPLEGKTSEYHLEKLSMIIAKKFKTINKLCGALDKAQKQVKFQFQITNWSMEIIENGSTVMNGEMVVKI